MKKLTKILSIHLCLSVFAGCTRGDNIARRSAVGDDHGKINFYILMISAPANGRQNTQRNSLFVEFNWEENQIINVVGTQNLETINFLSGERPNYQHWNMTIDLSPVAQYTIEPATSGRSLSFRINGGLFTASPPLSVQKNNAPSGVYRYFDNDSVMLAFWSRDNYGKILYNQLLSGSSAVDVMKSIIMSQALIKPISDDKSIKGIY